MTTEEDLDAEVDALLSFDEGEPDVHGAWRALQSRVSEQRPRRTRTWIVTALLAAAAAVFLLVWTSGPSASSGEVDASSRQTVAIGHRGVAVVEAGGALQWQVDDSGDARVQQSAGAVFYRVEKGDAFVVETPAGRATVTGTCFTLELKPMRNGIKLGVSAVAGAAAAAAVLLTVHEGSVVLANDKGQVEAKAGQTARARAGSAPLLGDVAGDDAATDSAPEPGKKSRYASLVRENSEQRRALRQLQEELAAARAEGQAEADDEIDRESAEYRKKVVRYCAVNGGCDKKLWTDPSVEELQELARCGRLLVDTPSFMDGGDFFPPGYVIESAGLSEDEATRYAEIAEGMYRDAGKQFADLAHELGVPEELIGRLSPYQLNGLVGSVIDGWEDTRHKVANERAGLSEPGEEQSASERALRYTWGLGDEFEQKLAAEFGPDAAKEMRNAGGGWAHKSSMGGRECME